MEQDPYFEAFLNDYKQQLSEMEDAKLEKFGKLMIQKSTTTAGVRAYGIKEILNDFQKIRASKTAELGIAGLEFGESKRRFGETLGETKRQFDIGTQQKEKELSLFEQSLKDLKDARKKERENWWKQYVGIAVGTGLSLGISSLFSAPAVGTAAGTAVGTAVGTGISSLFSAPAAQEFTTLPRSEPVSLSLRNTYKTPSYNTKPTPSLSMQDDTFNKWIS